MSFKSAKKRTPLIMVVEDDPDSMEVLLGRLRTEHLNYVSFRSAEDAIQALRVNLPALLITDIRLPGQSGFDILEFLRTNPLSQSVPAIAISAHHSDEMEAHSLMLGFNYVLSKPINGRQILGYIHQLIG